MSNITRTVIFNHPPISEEACHCGWVGEGGRVYSDHLLEEIDDARKLNDIEDVYDLPERSIVRDGNDECFTVLRNGYLTIENPKPPFTILYSPDVFMGSTGEE